MFLTFTNYPCYVSIWDEPENVVPPYCLPLRGDGEPRRRKRTSKKRLGCGWRRQNLFSLLRQQKEESSREEADVGMSAERPHLHFLLPLSSFSSFPPHYHQLLPPASFLPTLLHSNYSSSFFLSLTTQPSTTTNRPTDPKKSSLIFPLPSPTSFPPPKKGGSSSWRA